MTALPPPLPPPPAPPAAPTVVHGLNYSTGLTICGLNPIGAGLALTTYMREVTCVPCGADPIAVPLSIYEIPHGALILVVARVEALVDATPATEAWNGEPIPAQPAALRCATIGPNPSPFWVGEEDLAGARLFLEVRS